jgi:hypothetical protein
MSRDGIYPKFPPPDFFGCKPFMSSFMIPGSTIDYGWWVHLRRKSNSSNLFSMTWGLGISIILMFIHFFVKFYLVYSKYSFILALYFFK